MKNQKWWKNAVIYQIYPRSFKDSNNDGVGDLKGIISKLDYLQFLGVDAIWLSPIYESPMEDNGYDVSDYFKIAPIFGSMEDMDLLIEEGKKRNIKIIMDLVANHTSKEHIWFKEALKSKDNPYHDFFYWSKEKPFEKRADFGGSCWEYVPSLDEYYFHYFAVGQIDLNWTNPKVREEVAKMVTWWLNKGVAGFRMDAIELIGKDFEKDIYANGPKIHEYLRELNKNSFGKYEDAVTVGEGWPTPEIAIDYTNPDNKELNMMFNFDLFKHIISCPLGRWDPNIPNLMTLKAIFKEWQTKLNGKGWNTLFWENHDLARCVSTYGNDRFYRVESAKALAYMLYFQQGTPYIYQGQEIGMTNAYYNHLSDYNDIQVFGAYKELVTDSNRLTESQMIRGLQKGSRDNSRAPMQWDDSMNSGFNDGTKPWLKVIPNYKEINVKNAIEDKDSVLYTYKQIFEFRKSEEYAETILNGSYDTYLEEDSNIFVYGRTYQDKKFIVVVNFDDEEHMLNLNIEVKGIIMSNYKDSKCSTRNVLLRPYESIVFKIN